MSQRATAYASHWHGETCADCGIECVWDDEERTLSCDCNTRDAISVYLGETPTRECDIDD